MGMQYKQGSQYLCIALRRQYGVPVCQRIPSEYIDAWVVERFFEALSPIGLDAYQHSVEQQSRQQQQLDLVYRQHIQRLQYQATLAQRQFDRVEPENRLVAAELERRWEQALQELNQAQESYKHYQERPQSPLLPPELQEMFRKVGQRMPELWQGSMLSNAQKKAFLRCLIDKVVIHRSVPDQISTRIVWKGGATTTKHVAVSVGSFADLSFADEMEQDILELARQHILDEEIATRLTEKGYRSPMRSMVLPSTVRRIRVSHGVIHKPHQSHPRKVPGSLSVSQIAKQIGVSAHWRYDRIHNGRIQIAKDPRIRGYLVPNTPAMRDQLQNLKQGTVLQGLVNACSEPAPACSENLDAERCST
jgi:hypothetical protein